MNFVSDAIAEIEGLLDVNRDFCKKQMAQKACSLAPMNCGYYLTSLQIQLDITLQSAYNKCQESSWDVRQRAAFPHIFLNGSGVQLRMSCPRRKTPGDGRNSRQETSLLSTAGEIAVRIGILGLVRIFRRLRPSFCLQ